MKKNKEFMPVIEILAVGDHFINRAAQGIPEEKLANYPGASALEFVVALQKQWDPLNGIPIPAPTDQEESPSHQPAFIENQLSISHAVRIKSAQLWLVLGEADEALRELESLPTNAWDHPLAVEVRLEALGVLNHRSPVSVLHYPAGKTPRSTP